jgi:hypothetical protein
MTSQLGEKVVFEVKAKNRKALGCPRNDPRTSGDDFPLPKLTSIHLVFDFFTKLFSHAANAASEGGGGFNPAQRHDKRPGL